MATEHLVLISGSENGQRYPLQEKLTIGRNPDNDIFLDDLQVSRRHAVIERTPLGTVIRDLGSGNGTFVDDRRILEVRLTDGNVVTIGPFQFEFECEGAPRAIASHDLNEAQPSPSEQTVRTGPTGNVFDTLFRSADVPRDAPATEGLKARLEALYEANQIFASERDLNRLFARVMEQIFALVPAHNGTILLNETRSNAGPVVVADEAKGYRLVRHYVKAPDDDDVEVSSTIVRRAVEDGEALLTVDAAHDDRIDAGASIIAENIASCMCAPLIHQGEMLGVVYVDTRGTPNAFTQSDLDLLVALAGPAAIAIKNAQYVAKLEQAYEDTLLVLANTIEARDHYTVGHTWRVTNFSLAIAREMGWGEAELETCRKGGVLHDIGKIAVPDAILNKPGGLTEEEFGIMKVHPEKGARIMQDVELLAPMIPYALYHHERYDGKGYPFGLSRTEIPIEGRLVAVADTFDALTSNRPYRKGRPPEEARAVLVENKGTQFDPECVDAFCRAFDKGNIARVMQEFYKGVGKSVVCPFCSTYIPVPKEAVVGAVGKCGVCHRALRLQEQNDAYFAELVPETEVAATQPS